MTQQQQLQLLQDLERLQAGVKTASAYSRGVRDGLQWAEIIVKLKIGKEVFLRD